MPRETISATFEIVTPMFIAGADNGPTGIPALRVPSILGALRFWWRSLAWASLPGNTDDERLRRLRNWEAELFGSADSGQGVFLASLAPTAKARRVTPKPFGSRDHRRDNEGRRTHLDETQNSSVRIGGVEGLGDSGVSAIAYLAGLGLVELKRVLRNEGSSFPRFGDTRPAISPRQSFQLRLTGQPGFLDWRPNGAPNGPTVRQALTLFGLLGGLGARSRRAFGSVRFLTSKGSPFGPVDSIDEYVDAIRELRAPLQAGPNWNSCPPYSAFWRGMTIVLALHDEKSQTRRPGDVLIELGEEFQKYRAWGKNGRVGRQNAEWTTYAPTRRWRFEDDHDWYAAIKNGPTSIPPLQSKGRDGITRPFSDHAPRRAVFGLPQLYTKLDDGTTPAVKPGTTANQTKIERRASPLLFHVHEVSDEPPIPFAVLTLFESEFLPNQGSRPGTVQVEIETTKSWTANLAPDWGIIRSFMHGLTSARTVLP